MDDWKIVSGGEEGLVSVDYRTEPEAVGGSLQVGWPTGVVWQALYRLSLPGSSEPAAEMSLEMGLQNWSWSLLPVQTATTQLR